MARYRENFEFQLRDIELIENALRSELSRHAQPALQSDGHSNAAAAREISQLLAKIYHQKVFYSQVTRTGVPGG
jgi:hypothetical protein